MQVTNFYPTMKKCPHALFVTRFWWFLLFWQISDIPFTVITGRVISRYLKWLWRQSDVGLVSLGCCCFFKLPEIYLRVLYWCISFKTWLLKIIYFVLVLIRFPLILKRIWDGSHMQLLEIVGRNLLMPKKSIGSMCKPVTSLDCILYENVLISKVRG